ncbi:conserved hypothetical protein [Teredinibacter turnerae T7901]|uniref:Preprotein translocase subunit YajC n=1 Tax=Teredinibacter turnerae (strain ATCC 39867 / T7901) TaxID=377629 RepID=C5BL20_TERTT|nr:hypothetical protein [Teredinibacter turnerae]ACR14201.1 conserved hypothetical protein [Teredinibacter turnerae T7901]
MWQIILVLVFVVAMVVGPVMMMQPNKQERRLARLRSLAAKRGLRVNIGQNPANGEPHQIAVYSRLLPPPPKSVERPQWCVARQSLEHEINFSADWDWVAANRPDAALQAALKPWLLELPAAIRAVEMRESAVSVYWTESCWERQAQWQDSIEGCLGTIAKQLDWLAARAC